MKLSPSYICYVLPLLILYGTKFASLFYPYVFTCSSLGIIFIILTFINSHFNKIIQFYFPDLITYQFIDTPILYYISNVFIICIKLALIFFYPFNLSFEALVYSLYLLLIYLLYFFFYIIK